MQATEGQLVKIIVHRRGCRQDLYGMTGRIKQVLEVGNGIPTRYSVTIDRMQVSFWFARNEFEPV